MTCLSLPSAHRQGLWYEHDLMLRGKLDLRAQVESEGIPAERSCSPPSVLARWSPPPCPPPRRLEEFLRMCSILDAG